MNPERFEELEIKIMVIAKRIGVVSIKWVAKELNITEEEALEALEILHYRGDLKGKNHSGWYCLNRQCTQHTPV